MFKAALLALGLVFGLVFLVFSIASTAFAQQVCPTAAVGDSSQNCANTFWVNRALGGTATNYGFGLSFNPTTLTASLANPMPFGLSIPSPTLTGTPTAPTAGCLATSTQIATTGFVATCSVPSITWGAGLTFDIPSNTASLANPLPTGLTIPNPNLTGTPLAPTQAATDNSTKVATTQYVTTALSNAAVTYGTGLVLTGSVVSLANPVPSGLTIPNPTISNATITGPTISGGTITGVGYIQASGTTLPAQAAGKVALGGIVTLPALSANGEGDIVLSTSGGLDFIGQGSTSDESHYNKLGTLVFSIPTGTTNLSLVGNLILNGSAAIQGLNLPVNGTDAASKSYVDSAGAGQYWHTPVAAASTTALPNSPTYSNGSSGIGATLTAGSNGALVQDGYTVLLNDRVLEQNQASALQNGVYTETQLGDGSHPYILTRATDFNTACPMIPGQTATFTNGSANIVLATTAININCPVTFSTTGSLPTNFSVGTTYYVVSLSSLTITVSASVGGGAISAGSAGTGTQTANAPVTSGAVTGAAFLTLNGTTNSNKAFLLNTLAPITLGTTSLVFVNFSGAGSGSATGTVPIVVAGGTAISFQNINAASVPANTGGSAAAPSGQIAYGTTGNNTLVETTGGGLITNSLISALPFTSLATLSANQLLGALSTGTPSGIAVPSCTDTSGNHLNYTSSVGFSCGTSGASPAYLNAYIAAGFR